jgi:hypothetical protein
MDTKIFDNAIEIMKEKLGDAFLSCSIWSNADGQPVATYDPHKALDVGAATALFNQVTKYIRKSLKDAHFPVELNKYYFLDLTGNHIALAAQLGEYQWGMLIDANKTTMGFLLNIALPEAMALFK